MIRWILTIIILVIHIIFECLHSTEIHKLILTLWGSAYEWMQSIQPEGGGGDAFYIFVIVAIVI